MNPTRIVVVHVNKHLSGFKQWSGKPGHGIVPVNIKNYCLSNSSVTHEITKIGNYSIYRRLGYFDIYHIFKQQRLWHILFTKTNWSKFQNNSFQCQTDLGFFSRSAFRDKIVIFSLFIRINIWFGWQWVHKQTISLRWFFWVCTTYVFVEISKLSFNCTLLSRSRVQLLEMF